MKGSSLYTVDLFAGAGGLSCGFSQAGFCTSLAVEKDLWASETYSVNHPDSPVLIEDICNIPDEKFSAFKGADVVMGGPPCQGFSISASNRRKINDPRNMLYLEFIRVVSLIKPKAVLIENVKEIKRFILPDGKLLCDDIQERLSNLGYYSAILTLNAAAFGIPQTRLRTFILATQDLNRLNKAVSNLNTTQSQSTGLFSNKNEGLTLWDAISDLPAVVPCRVAEDSVLEYISSPLNSYQARLRKGSKEIHNHVPMRHTPRMIERFRHILEDSVSLPDELSPRARGNPEILSGKVYDQNHRQLQPDKLSPTITASFYSSFIHPYQPRNLTVREAARLQSFPDSYIFRGKRTTLSKKLLAKKGVFEDLYLDQFNQVGNSVPPLLARCLAEEVKRVISL